MIHFVRVLGVLLCLVTAKPVLATTKQQELENLRSRIAEVTREMDQTSASKSKAIDAIRESERAINSHNRKLAELKTQQRMVDRKLTELKTQQQNLSATLRTQQQLLGKQLYLQYISGNSSYLEQLLSGQDPNRMTRELQYYQYLARDRNTRLTALRGNLDTLKTTRSAVHEQDAQLAALVKEEIIQRSDLKKSKQEHQKILKQFSQQLRQQRREVNRLQRDETHLANLVAKLAKMLAQPKTNSMFANDGLPTDHFDAHPFAQLKGKLPLPVKGRISNRFDTPRPDSTVRWKGLFLKASSGQSVRSVANGRVVFSDWLRGFGNLLIIDHGMNYMSLYGNNETLYKQVGDLIEAGETVASAGNSGSNVESGLYFELRHESTPLDPIIWFATK